MPIFRKKPIAQQSDTELYEVLFATAMNTAKQAMDYVQNNPGKFDVHPGDDKLAIVCREFLKAQQLTEHIARKRKNQCQFLENYSLKNSSK